MYECIYKERIRVVMTKIICPNCESIESASIEYFHECSNCGYIITDSDWQEVEDEDI